LLIFLAGKQYPSQYRGSPEKSEPFRRQAGAKNLREGGFSVSIGGTVLLNIKRGVGKGKGEKGGWKSQERKSGHPHFYWLCIQRGKKKLLKEDMEAHEYLPKEG